MSLLSSLRQIVRLATSLSLPLPLPLPLPEKDIGWFHGKTWNYPRSTFGDILLASGMKRSSPTMETSTLMGKNVAALIGE